MVSGIALGFSKFDVCLPTVSEEVFGVSKARSLLELF